jgi:ABC-type transporter Mla subunit MlaD
MRRLLAIVVLAGAVGAIAVLGTGAGDSSSHYEVRAIFRNAFSVIPGEDVKIAGVKVGKIKSLGVTADQKAAVVLDITKAGFQDFRTDASCTIRPQSLIGEKFVECTPTQPRQQGAQPAPELAKIKSGSGKGQRLLPVGNTSRPVDIDLLGNITRLPYRQRLSIILNEFGAAVAGHGEDLRSIIRNADPGLKQTDRVLRILGDQNKVLEALARDSDRALSPLGAQADKVAGFVEHANTVATATADKRSDFELGLSKLPEFLRQLRPTMQRLGGLSDQMTPALLDLGKAAPDLNTFVKQLGPFSRSATTSLTSLGSATVPGRKALVKAKPIVGDLKTFATAAKPLAKNLKETLQSFKATGGVERLLDYAFYQTTAINGFDSVGHYLRAQLVVNLCSVYATTADPACSAHFSKTGTRTSAAEALAAKNNGITPALARENAVLRGMTPDQALGRKTHKKAKSKGTASLPPLALPTQLLPGGGQAAPPASAQQPKPSAQSPSNNAVKSLLDYLLGNGP